MNMLMSVRIASVVSKLNCDSNGLLDLEEYGLTGRDAKPLLNIDFWKSGSQKDFNLAISTCWFSVILVVLCLAILGFL